MLYDNGLILEFLAEVWLWGIEDGDLAPSIARAADKTVAWLKREMRFDMPSTEGETSPMSAGFFYSAQDADNFADAEDVEPEEGDFYMWRLSICIICCVRQSRPR